MDELKTRVRVSDVVGKSVKLKRQGREYAGLSPFTNEKTPSFFVNDEKGFYHCFSSGKHGDAISFLMEVENLSFPEAVERLAGIAGMELPQADPQAEARAARNKETVNWIEEAQSFFVKSLYRDIGAEARDYLKGRGLTKTAADRFGIGFAPDDFTALRDELVQKGASVKMLVEAGLCIEPEDSSREPWDRFRNRIMFPIRDPRGRLVAFGGRAMAKDAKAKYLNSPETNLFHKGSVLYRYPEARKALGNPQNPMRGMIVAEGYMDVIALARAGFEEAVAPLGTALTEDQLDLLWRAGPEPILCFDGDRAGAKAAMRSVERILPKLKPGQTARFAMLPEGQDPDDLIAAKGASAMRDVLDRAIPLVDMLWAREKEAGPLSTPEDKAGLKDRIYKALREITHDGVREQYKTELLARFDSEFGWKASRKGGGYTARGRGTAKASPAMKQTMARDAMSEARERRIMGAILEWPLLLDTVDETFFSLQFSSEPCRQLQNTIQSYYSSTIAVDKQGLHAHIEGLGLKQHLTKFLIDRALCIAAMGGGDATLNERQAIWMTEAAALSGPVQEERTNGETQSRIVESIHENNADVLRRLMRAAKNTRR
ncbi:DNA primase [Fretibacter rubidus]|uniref:DNA primase n=1 Tax=Fretibacter rubidus TaxID=570162 RepID=UPI00352B9A2A